MESTLDVRLTNRTATFLGEYPKDELRQFFSYHPPSYRFMPAFRRGGWDGRVSLFRYGAVPAGLFRALRAELAQKTGLRCKVHRLLPPVTFQSGLTSDRQYQNECVAKMVDATRLGGGLILSATGSGKTYTAAMYFSRLSGHACFIVDELTLMNQAREELERALNEQVGQVGNQIFAPERITVATVQTLHRHRENPKFTLWTDTLSVLIIDEIHVAMNRRNFETVRAIEPVAVFGLTATLELGKKHVRMRAYALAGPVLYTYPMAAGIAQGYLTPGIVGCIRYTNPVFARDDYRTAYADRIVDNARRNQLVKALVEEAYSRKKSTIVLVERIAHLKTLSQMLRRIPHRLVYGKKSVEKRIEAQKKLEGGRIRLIIANKVFKKGINIARVDVIVDAAALRSKNDAVQKYGRGIRLCEGKTGLLYFDISDYGGKKNPFYRASKSRARALRAAGAETLKFDADGDVEFPDFATAVFDKMERKLATKTVTEAGSREQGGRDGKIAQKPL